MLWKIFSINASGSPISSHSRKNRPEGMPGWPLANLILCWGRPAMALLLDSGKYLGPHPDISQQTFPLCRAAAVISPAQGGLHGNLPRYGARAGP